jgi:RND family efflux transporter MFP subunit
MAVDDRLSDLLVDWEQSRRGGVEPSLEELCRDTPELLPVLRESIDSLRATEWMLQPQPSEPSIREANAAALHDTELPASHLTAQEFAASIFQSGLLSKPEIAELRQRLDASHLPGEAREIASKLVTEGKLTRYQAAVLLKASKDPLLIDNYVILDTLDTGGMGLVFKALHRSMNRVVALKLLPASMMGARDTVKRFQREVQAAAALKHPNVVAAYDADESAEIAYLVLEYVDGINLYRLVKDRGPRSLVEAADYVCQAARGLAYLHSRRIIHRDVKPANLILANDGTVKLLDMGLVRFASSEDLSCSEMDQELTQAGIVIGTVAYMSPEQALDTRSADQRSDIYSLGCTLFFLLTGRALYHEETGMKTLLAHREQAVPSIREFCEEAPVSLDAVFRTMVAKRPADRLQSMEEVIAAIEACVPGLPSVGESSSRSASNPLKLIARARPKPIWRSRKLGFVAAAGVIAATLLAVVYLAVVLIRIKTKEGTIEVSTNDSNPKIEIVNTPGEKSPANQEKKTNNAAVRPRRRRRALEDKGVANLVPGQAEPIHVVTATVHKGDFKDYLQALGTVTASQTVAVRPRVDGEIVKVYFKAGQIVHAGDPLFDIDPRPYETRVDEEKAQLRRDEASHSEAAQALKRGQAIAASHGISDEELASRSAAVEQARGAIEKDQARIKDALLQVGFCHITAPISGRVGLRVVEKGNVVRAAGDTKLAEIVQFQPIAIVVPFPLRDVYNLQQRFNSGTELIVEAFTGNGTGTWVRGRLAGIDNEADAQTGNVGTKAIFENTDSRLFPGSSVPVRLLIETRHGVLLVPNEAIRHDGSGDFVCVVKADQTVERRAVKVQCGESACAIKSGLAEGELVVVEPSDKLTDGTKVELTDRNSGAASQTPKAALAATAVKKAAEPIVVETATVHKGDFKVRLFLQGNVRPSRTQVISARVDGEVTKVYPKQGQLVHAGDPLFELDDRPYRPRWEEAKAQVEREQATLKLAEQDLARAQKLRAAKSMPQEELDKCVAAVGRAIGDVGKARAAVDSARLQLNYCHITAPITGRIGLRIAEAGNGVRAYTDQLADIVQAQPIAVVIALPHSELARLRQALSSRTVTVEAKALSSRTLTAFEPNGASTLASGKLVAIDNKLTPGGNVLSEATFENEDNLLYPGEFVNVTLTLETRQDVLLIPNTAILHNEAGSFVFVVRPDQTVESRKITAESGGTESAVTNGLSEGDTVVIKGLKSLVDGAKIELPQSPSDAESRVPNVSQPTAGVAKGSPVATRILQDLVSQTQSGAASKRVGFGNMGLNTWPSEDQMIALMNAETTADRAIARWVHAYHGNFAILQEGAERIGIRDGEEIPPGDFHIAAIILTDQPVKVKADQIEPHDPSRSDRVRFPEEVVSRLQHLAHLDYLELKCRDFSDQALQSVGRLTALKELRLRHANITDDGLKSLGALKNLNWLSLADTPITDKGLEILARAGLFATRRSEAPTTPWDRQSKPTLWLDGTRTTESGIVAFQKSAPGCVISAAHVMDVRRTVSPNPYYVPAPVPPAPGSTDRVWAEWLLMNLNGTWIHTDVDPETAVTAWRSLPPIEFHVTRIGFNRQTGFEGAGSVHLTPFIIRRLADLPMLEAIAFNPPSAAWFPAVATLTRLKSLSLEFANMSADANIHDAALKPIGGMTNLQSLLITSERITDAGLENFARLTELTTLQLSGARYLHGSGFKQLSGLKKLKRLNVANSGLDDGGLAEIAALASLEQLDVSGTWISDSGLAQLARLPRLKNLDLSHCRRIDDAGFETLSKLPHLRTLNLDSTRATVESIPLANARRELVVEWPLAVRQQMNNSQVMQEAFQKYELKQRQKRQ